MRLVTNWKRSLRWFSTQAHLINLAFLGTWSTLPEKFQDALEPPWVIGIAAALIVLGVVGRVIDQTPKDAP